MTRKIMTKIEIKSLVSGSSNDRGTFFIFFSIFSELRMINKQSNPDYCTDNCTND